MDSSDEEMFVVALLCEEEWRLQKKKCKKPWVRDNLKSSDREGQFFIPLFKGLLDDQEKFHAYFRMSFEKFAEILRIVEPHIQKQDTRFRKAIEPKERLAVCLRYLATGESFNTIAARHRLGHATVHHIIHELCEAIWDALSPVVMPFPTIEMWRAIEKEFYTKWNFPNCLGILLGKHVIGQTPSSNGSLNYDKVFIALIDANYNFVTIDIGAYGNNGGVFANSMFKNVLDSGKLNFPPDKILPGTDDLASHVVLGDEAFPLKTNVLRPYRTMKFEKDELKLTFNNHLNKVLKVADNMLAILSQRFQIYDKQIQLKSENVDKIILATCCLHNFLRDDTVCLPNLCEANKTYIPILENLQRVGGSATADARRNREKFKNFFGSL